MLIVVVSVPIERANTLTSDASNKSSHEAIAHKKRNTSYWVPFKESPADVAAEVIIIVEDCELVHINLILMERCGDVTIHHLMIFHWESRSAHIFLNENRARYTLNRLRDITSTFSVFLVTSPRVRAVAANNTRGGNDCPCGGWNPNTWVPVSESDADRSS